MPISTIDTVKLNGLNDTARTLLKVGISPAEIPEIMAEEISQFESTRVWTKLI